MFIETKQDSLPSLQNHLFSPGDIRLIPLVPMVIFTVNLELLQPGLMVCHIKCLAGFEIVYQFLTTDQTTSLVNTQIEK